MNINSNKLKIDQTEDWDIVIESKTSLFDLKLKEVWRYRDLLWLLIRRDFVAFYKQTVFGPIWFFIQPIFTTITFVFVFGKLAGISTDGLPQPLFYLAGITGWSYFSECFLKTSTVLKDNANIFGKVYFPRIIMPLSVVISNLVKFSVQFLLLLLIIVYYLFTGYNFQFSLYILALPVLILTMAIQGLSFGLIISSLTTKYRDLALLLSFGIQLLMYATPVAYPLSSLSGKIKFFVQLNPVTYIIEGFKKSILGVGEFNFFNLLYTLFISLFLLLLSLLIFNKVEKDFVDTI
jgi:lipopolysaccharide transport system permease protein